MQQDDLAHASNVKSHKICTATTFNSFIDSKKLAQKTQPRSFCLFQKCSFQNYSCDTCGPADVLVKFGK